MRAIVDFFISRHFLVHVMVAVVVVVGLNSAMTAQREGFPSITLNQLIVTATLPGASAQDVETKVTIPLEDAIEGVDGVDEYNSVVTDNVSITTVEIYEDWSPQQVREVQSDLRQAIDGVRDFPDDMEDEPVVSRVEPAKMPVIEIALEGPSSAVKEAAERLERRLERVEGVSDVTLVGVEDPEVQILLDPVSARTYSVDLNDIIAAIDRRNVSGTGGILESDSDRKQVVMNARFVEPEDVAATPLRVNPDGGVVRIGDVARVVSTTEDSGLRVHTNGRPGVSVVVRKKTDADIIAAVDAIKAASEEVELPEGVEASYIGDQSFIVRNRLGVMASNGIVGIVLVVIVLGLFLTRKAALWVAVGVPVVLLGVLVLLPAVGLTLNLITLGGLVMVLGLLVDDAVVVAERIVTRQHDDDSDTPESDAVLSVAKPVIASALTTSLAFTPMMALGGMPGKVAWALPVVVVLALILSLVESFFVLPAHMHVSPEKRARTKSAMPKRRFVVVMERTYARVLRSVLKLRYLVVAGFVALFAFVMIVLGPRMGFDLFPQDDAEALYIKVNMPLGTPVEQTEAAATVIERQLPELMGSDLLAVTARVGHQEGAAVDKLTGSAENEAVITAMLEPLDRDYTAAQWAEILSDTLHVPDEASLIFEAKRLGPPMGSAATIHLASNDDELRRSNAARVRGWLESIDGVVDIEVDERPGIRQIELAPDPDKLAMRGLDASVVALTLKAAFHGLTVSEHRSLDETTRFRVMFEPTARVDLDALLDTPIRARNGTLVSLRDVVSPVEVAAVSRIYHRDGVRAATVTASFAPDSDLDSSKLAKRIETELLPSIRTPGLEAYQGGEATETQKTQASMGRAAALAVFGMVVVIAVMLGSFVDALFVISVIPFGIGGVVTAFYLHDKALSMFAVLGIIGLSGVVVNASIVMLDAAKQRQAEAAPDRASQRAAIIDAVVERFRPILVTTLTTLGGVLPTAYGLGGYDATLSPMSLALGWGLVFATSITLVLVPSLFAIAEDIRALFRRGRVATVSADGTQPAGH
ncbi:MAG: efflux RND transporter permease subunit [Nannocystaceae bacterium]|nr:efflux RND transporter permease subunit [bacterium]